MQALNTSCIACKARGILCDIAVALPRAETTNLKVKSSMRAEYLAALKKAQEAIKILKADLSGLANQNHVNTVERTLKSLKRVRDIRNGFTSSADFE